MLDGGHDALQLKYIGVLGAERLLHDLEHRREDHAIGARIDWQAERPRAHQKGAVVERHLKLARFERLTVGLAENGEKHLTVEALAGMIVPGDVEVSGKW